MKQIIVLIPWILGINSMAYWLNRTKVREWAFPLPFLMCLVSILLVSIWGFITVPVASFADFIKVVVDSIPSGVFCAVMATEGYEIYHEWTKRKPQWVKVWNAVMSVFKRKGANNG